MTNRRKFYELSQDEINCKRLVGMSVKTHSVVPGTICLRNMDDYDKIKSIVYKKLGEPTSNSTDKVQWYLPHSMCSVTLRHKQYCDVYGGWVVCVNKDININSYFKHNKILKDQEEKIIDSLNYVNKETDLIRCGYYKDPRFNNSKRGERNTL